MKISFDDGRSRNHSSRRVHLSFAILSIALMGLLASQEAYGAKEPKKRVAVTAFDTSVRNYGGRDIGEIGDGLPSRLVEALRETGKFVVLERRALADVLAEQNLETVAPVKPGVLSRLTSAQALIRGIITNIDTIGDDQGGMSVGRFQMGGGLKRVVVTLNISVIDTVTGQIIESKTVEGTARVSGLKLISNTKKGSVNYKGKRVLPLSKAVDQAIKKAVSSITAGMESQPWRGSIVEVSGSQVIINAGREENVEPGLRLRVFAKGKQLIDRETNEDLGSLDEEIGLIEVNSIEAKFSTARVVEGQGFAPGNLIRPLESY